MVEHVVAADDGRAMRRRSGATATSASDIDQHAAKVSGALRSGRRTGSLALANTGRRGRRWISCCRCCASRAGRSPTRIEAAIDVDRDGGHRAVRAGRAGREHQAGLPRHRPRHGSEPTSCYAREREQAGPVIEEVYETFLPINDEVKQIVTDWQMREVDGTTGPQRPSGPCARRPRHRPAARHRRQDRQRRLASLSAVLPRFDGYSRRLRRALAEIRDGDHTMVAAPIKDSYHTVWFELHEELLVLSGRRARRVTLTLQRESRSTISRSSQAFQASGGSSVGRLVEHAHDRLEPRRAFAASIFDQHLLSWRGIRNGCATAALERASSGVELGTRALDAGPRDPVRGSPLGTTKWVPISKPTAGQGLGFPCRPRSRRQG